MMQERGRITLLIQSIWTKTKCENSKPAMHLDRKMLAKANQR